MIRRSAGRRLARVVADTRGRSTPAALVARLGGRAAALARRVARRKRLVRLVVLPGAAGTGLALGGPVAGLVAATYSMFVVCAWQARRERRDNERAAARAVEVVGALASELRAGSGPLLSVGDPLSAAALFGADETAPAVMEAAARVTAARRISERLGAPLADLLDRIDDDLRARHRLRVTVRAKTAGCRATAVLLAALPVAGLALGTGIGAHPVDQLLGTPLGAVCAALALGLQVLGLIWTSGMVRAATETV